MPPSGTSYMAARRAKSHGKRQASSDSAWPETIPWVDLGSQAPARCSSQPSTCRPVGVRLSKAPRRASMARLFSLRLPVMEAHHSGLVAVWVGTNRFGHLSRSVMRAAGCSKSSPSSRARLGCAFRGSVGLHPPPAAALSVWGRTSPPKAGTACFVLRDHQPKLSPAGVSFLMVTLRGGELPAFGGAAGAFFFGTFGR